MWMIIAIVLFVIGAVTLWLSSWMVGDSLNIWQRTIMSLIWWTGPVELVLICLRERKEAKQFVGIDADTGEMTTFPKPGMITVGSVMLPTKGVEGDDPVIRKPVSPFKDATDGE